MAVVSQHLSCCTTCLLTRNGWAEGWPGCCEEKGASSCCKLNSDHPDDGQLFHFKGCLFGQLFHLEKPQECLSPFHPYSVKRKLDVSFEELTVVSVKITVFWDVTSVESTMISLKM